MNLARGDPPAGGRRSLPIAPRREVLILLPAALLLLALLSTYSLFSYRGTVDLLIEERQAEAAALARQLSGELMAVKTLPGSDALRRRVPQARRVAILDSGGAEAVATASAADPEGVAGSSRFKRGDEVLTVIVELPAVLLRGRQRGLEILTPVLLTVNVAVSVLVLLFLRRFLAPFDRLVETARHAGQEVPDSQDEVVFLVETFEKALAALARPPGEAPASDERKALELTLTKTLSQLGELTAGVAHELRNSLATLRGYVTLIARAPEGESVAEYLDEIRRESDHLERVLEDFLTFARPGSARPQEVDLLGLLHRAAADPALGDAAVAVDGPVDGGDQEAPGFRVWGDSQLLERAVRNVLSNAAQAQRDAGCPDPVHARLARRAGGVEIAIEDRGPGLSPEAREKLFDPFFTQRAGGVGMGLALTRRIVLLHAGRIAVEDREGGGTRAVLWIPRGKVVTEGDETARPSAGAQAGGEEVIR